MYCPKCEGVDLLELGHKTDVRLDSFHCRDCSASWTRQAYLEMGKPVKVTVPSHISIADAAAEQLFAVQEFLNKIENKYERARLYQTFTNCIERLGNLKQPALYKDFAPLSFGFSGSGLHGGMIFHGPCDGGAPNFSVTMVGTHGWQMHE